MFKRLLLYQILFVAVITFLSTPALGASLVLLTPEEADKLSMSEMDWLNLPRALPMAKGKGMAISNGPAILFEDPVEQKVPSGSVLEATSPTTMWVRFEQKLAPVDISTLDVKVCKSFFCKQLNDLLAPYIVGTELRAENVEIPKGNFKVTIVIADQQGNITQEDFLLKIAK